MKYPSEYLEDLVPVVDRLEDRALDRYEHARWWLAGFKVWNWMEQARRIEDLKSKNAALVRELKDLGRKYQEETGKPTPIRVTLLWADDEALAAALRTFGRALDEMRSRLQAKLEVRR